VEVLKILHGECSRLEADKDKDKGADKFLEQAEERSQLILLAKVNALKRGAKTKRHDIVKLDADIDVAKSKHGQ